MALLTAEEVANLFPYGMKTVPASLVDDKLIRPAVLPVPTPENVDINQYMDVAGGPGRFASPVFFKVIKQFFSSTSSG